MFEGEFSDFYEQIIQLYTKYFHEISNRGDSFVKFLMFVIFVKLYNLEWEEI